VTDHRHPVESASTTEALPISPSLGPTLAAAHLPIEVNLVDRRVVHISLLSILLGLAAAVIAKVLMSLIAVITNLVFFGKLSLILQAPAGNHLGWWVVLIPVIGGIIVGIMARYGSAGIRGHGIPEAMEQVLLNESRIPARLTFLKPLSAAIAIGTGGPFGAEGPIIATGGALGSLVGQLLSTTALERKTLLAAGAAAGMAATFAAPVSAVLLAIELLLFEFRPRSFLPVALASTVAAGARFALHMPYPVFELPALSQPSLAALGIYLLLGLLMGVASVIVTRAVYWIEDLFDETHIHWMWWPAMGAVAVGVIGHFQPRTLGVGYENISDVLSTHLTLWVVIALCSWKFISWAIALGSGTSGGTLAPLFTVGAGLGFALGAAAKHAVPGAGVELPIAALVGMAAMFAGASRALLTSVVFAFETTLQPLGLLPLLGGCTASYFVSCLLMRNTIMTEKIARRGVRVPSEYEADLFAQIKVSDVATPAPTTVADDEKVEALRTRINSGESAFSHQGFPVVDSAGILVGMVTRKDISNPSLPPTTRIRELLRRPPILVYDDLSLREAADHMVNHSVGRLPVIQRGKPGKVIGIITRGDILAAQRRRVDEMKMSKSIMFRSTKAK
jgi:H+/Cl- antiporter ClcA/CBS domain-containing protein